ncbi:hypothetical protein PV08_11712 [Exophiala spinifera]|uniref:Uncharacterized protein n=1 Tax=Exophiala spinifera TaxID=91928 RepID=A0A0D1Y4T2_9EURO|nr:uncharacterized protein PV08_11712 [Exophiala spinifera]KIW09936.1 hypothetical protein PV08_11712 [Exophiala spinifera]
MVTLTRGLILVASFGAALADAWQQTTTTALTTVTPCPSPAQWKTPAPITVTAQYQPVSTCSALDEVCVKNKCFTKYSYSTWNYVSTTIPCPFAAPSSTISTITATDQSVLVSRTSTTITNTQITSTVTKKWKRPFTHIVTVSAYTTVVKEWSAPYNQLGSLAIPGYGGSGICTDCKGDNGQKRQSLDVIECFESRNKPTICREYKEVWIYNPRAIFSHTASAVCSSRTSVPSAGTYVFEFPQKAPPTTIEIPVQKVTHTWHGGVIVSTNAATTAVFPGRDWTATVTRHCARPTVIEFDIIITKVIVYVVPPFVFPDGPTKTDIYFGTMVYFL